ncbi:PEP-CTERM/exosortase system-associated acyltransferase [Marinobacterium rhizophilum]|uniref:PEP-CTERM/exosortase system-associated acyltransferase n=1 Tax=Marinobacterium rhizophilum TaxID=420402 RepID=UPI00037F6987|nr:PEP-CTERM/exosortase system-associated acyltransferase [Marinobacterium rhizophilum]
MHEIPINFKKYFSIRLADTQAQRREAFRIRYEVYCDELGFEEKDAFPDGLERDAFDSISDHLLLVHNSSQNFVGTVRFVHTSTSMPEQILPLEKYCSHAFDPSLFDLKAQARGSIAEVSRLAVSAQFRRRSGEKGRPFIFEGMRTDISDHAKNFPYIAVGLYLGAAALCVLQKYHYVVVMMEPRLARGVSRVGIRFQRAGEPIKYHGIRAPYYISPDILLEHLIPPIREMFDDIYAQLEKQLPK